MEFVGVASTEGLLWGGCGGVSAGEVVGWGGGGGGGGRGGDGRGKGEGDGEEEEGVEAWVGVFT